MSDSIIIQFVHPGLWKSAYLYSHWDGTDLIDGIIAWAQERTDLITTGETSPLQRLESDVCLVDFLHWYLLWRNHTPVIDGNYRLLPESETGTDHGLHLIDLPALFNTPNDSTTWLDIQ